MLLISYYLCFASLLELSKHKRVVILFIYDRIVPAADLVEIMYYMVLNNANLSAPSYLAAQDASRPPSCLPKSF